MSERDNECTQSWADASECHAYNNGICMNGIKCGGIPNYPPQPAPDLPALLARCKEMLQQVSAQKAMIKTIEQYEDYTGGEPNLGTCKTLGKLKTIADNATALLSEIAKVEEAK